MEFRLTQETSEQVFKCGASDIIKEFSDQLADFLKPKQYGKDLETLYIGIICVSPEFDFFFKVRKPKYSKRRTIIQDGRPYELINNLIYDIKLDYQHVINADRKELINIFCKQVVESLECLELVKIKDFNTIQFKSDIVDFLNSLS
jgi:hypothetical protein